MMKKKKVNILSTLEPKLGSLKNTVFVCLDCEFTGLDLENDRVIEIAAVRFTFEDGVIDEYDQLINPNYPIGKESMKIHNIRQNHVPTSCP